MDLEIHGDLTFSGIPYTMDEGHWFGFDCARAGDNYPFMSEALKEFGTYKDLDFVMKECEGLARQLYDC